mgnify:CR=1 FL=1
MKTRKGFTLVELLVVIAIVSVLAAMLLPSVEMAYFQSRLITCANTHKQRYLAMSQYFLDNNYQWPTFFPIPAGTTYYMQRPMNDTVAAYYVNPPVGNPPSNYTVYYNFGVLYWMGYFNDPMLIVDADFRNEITDTQDWGVWDRHVVNVRRGRIFTDPLVTKQFPSATNWNSMWCAQPGLFGCYPWHQTRAPAAMKKGYITNRENAGWNISNDGATGVVANRKANPVIAMCTVGIPRAPFGGHQNKAANATRGDGSVGVINDIEQYSELYYLPTRMPNLDYFTDGISMQMYFAYWRGFANIWDYADYKLGVTGQ